MSPHPVLNLLEERKSVPVRTDHVDEAVSRLQGRPFSSLSPLDKDDLLMVLGRKLGIVSPEP